MPELPRLSCNGKENSAVTPFEMADDDDDGDNDKDSSPPSRSLPSNRKRLGRGLAWNDTDDAILLAAVRDNKNKKKSTLNDIQRTLLPDRTFEALKNRLKLLRRDDPPPPP